MLLYIDLLSITISGTRCTIPPMDPSFLRPDAPSSRTRIVADSHRTRRGVQQMSSTGRCCCDLYVVHGIIHQKHQRSFEIVEVILIFANFLDPAPQFHRHFGILCMFIHIPASLSGGGFASASSGTSGSICKKKRRLLFSRRWAPTSSK